MCSVYGALLHNLDLKGLRAANSILEFIAARSKVRGRDGLGFSTQMVSMYGTVMTDEFRTVETTPMDRTREHPLHLNSYQPLRFARVLGNLRAEPTTEFVKEKKAYDQQPYQLKKWAIVHNGTIANDAQIRTHAHPSNVDSAAIVEVLEDGIKKDELRFYEFTTMLRKLIGSYAIIAAHQDQHKELYVGVNYRPVWYIETEYGVFFASCRNFLPPDFVPQMVEPYSAMMFGVIEGRIIKTEVPMREPSKTNHTPRALVVCSGGLDSTVAAAAKLNDGYEVELIHFTYGCRAEVHEVDSVKAIAEELGVKCTIFPLPVYKMGESRLLDADAEMAGGEAGAEYAHEWVPARNLLLLSVAVARAEAQGIEEVVLGNNLEEAGAYPDNEPEFIDRMNDMLPFAVGDGKRVRITMPVGNLVKHEIVALGREIGAPLHLTWSCYKNGKLHCGKCGPCFMRRTAFEINKLPEVIPYAD